MEETQISWAEKIRKNLALIIISFVTIGLTVISVVIINKAMNDPEKGTETMKEIFHTLLPVLASWVGTVLAFYFGKENFESANKQINQLVNKITPEVFKDLPVTQVMIDYDTMVKYPDADSATTKVSDLKDAFDKITDKSRLPIIDKDKKPLFILHKTEFDVLSKDETTKEKLLADFKENGYGHKQSRGFVIVSESATLKEALAALKTIVECKDVFITKGGTEKEPLTGWLPDIRILNFIQ
jgi:hypothetical protein